MSRAVRIILLILFVAFENLSYSQSPGFVSDSLTLWLKADAGVTGASPVTAWTDQSGNVPDALKIGDAPDLLNDHLNFNPVLDFNGNNDYLSIAGGILDNGRSYNDLWIYAVTKSDFFSNDRALIYERGSNGRLAIIPHRFNNINFYSGGSSYNISHGANTLDFNIWMYGTSTGTATPSGVRKSIARDGAYRGGGSNTSSFITGNGSNFLIGGGWDNGNGTSNNVDLKLAELIVYSGVPSVLDQEKIQTYLALKYGITKNSANNASTAVQDERNYFASDGTTIVWDFAANSVYHNDVAGIGRDDNSGLDQQKSKSSNYRAAVTLDKAGAFSSDKDFIVWGNDGADSTSTDVIVGYDIRTSRVWKTAVTGAPGSVNFSIDLAGLGFELQSSVAGDFALLIDDDGTFAPNATAHTTGATLNNGLLSFTNVTFSDGDFFAIAGPEISAAPGQVRLNLALWLKADEGITGATPVTAWADQSGNLSDAEQVGTAPDLLTDEINFNPALDFDGSNDYLRIAGGILDNNETHNDVWVYAVSKYDAFNNTRALFYQRGSNGRFALIPHNFNNANYYNGGGSYGTSHGANSIEYNMWTLGASTSTNTPSGTRISIARDGAYRGAGINTNSFITGNGSDFILGGGWDNGIGTSNNANFKLAEFIIYSGIPSELDQEKIQTYLALKYGLTKNSDDNGSTGGQDERDYFASDGTTIVWDYSDNSAYHNDVAGIGRDDLTSLDQRKSKSSNNQSVVTLDKAGAFASDNNFIVWGNDGVDGCSTDVIGGYDVRSSRVWKVAVTGAPGSVNFSIDLTGMGFDLQTSVAADFALLIDDDGLFAPNASAHTTGPTLSNGVLSFTNVNFSDGDFFAIAGPEIPSAPGQVKLNLALWLKADAGVTGATPVTAWADQSGSLPDAVRVGTAPDLLNDQINFNPVLDFDGNNDYLQIAGGLLENNTTYNDLWVYTVSKSDLLSNNRVLLYERASNGRFAVMPNTFNNTRYNTGNGDYSTGHGANTVDYNIWTFGSSTSTATPSGTRKSIARDGAYRGGGSNNSHFVTGNTSDFLIGGGWDNGNGTSNNADFKLAELIIYTGIPTPLDQEKIQTYLALKYGLTKNSADNVSTGGTDEQDYIASDGTTIVWDYSANSAYHNDVAGIGRDDGTTLDQRQSRSSNYQTAVTLDNGGAFSTDNSFIVWGNDGTIGCSTDVIGGYDVRSTRVWKVAVTGAPGSVNFTVDLTGMGFDLQNGVPADFALLIDDDGTFAPNASAHITGAALNNALLSFTNVNFSDGDFFAIAGPAIPSAPGYVKLNLALWLKADAGVTGATPVTAWTDQSGSLPDAVQIGTAPDLLNDQINFNPVLDFDGNNDYLQITGGLLENTRTYNDIWVYGVSKSDLLSNNRVLVYEGASNGRLAVMPNTFNSIRYNLGNGSYNTGHGANTIDYNIWTLGSSTSTATPSGTRKSIARDGAYRGAGSDVSHFITGNGSHFLIGGGWDNGNGTSNNADIKLAELIVYTGIPTPLDQEKIQTYLALKYGLTKNSADNVSTGGTDEQDYIASDGTTIVWDYSANSAYHNDVAGIGRDDRTTLDQRQSRSSNYQTAVTLDKGGAFPTDNSFIVWGNDGTSGCSSDVIGGYDVRSTRVWKVAVTGVPGSVNFTVDLTGMGFDLQNGLPADFALLIDDDGTFAPNASAHTTGAALNNALLSFTNVNFSDGDFFAIAGPAIPAAPGSVKLNLALWLKADAGVTGGTPVTAWSDQSGSYPDAVQIGTAPDLLSDQVNFNPVLDFDGNNDYLQITGGILENTRTYNDIWVYVVSKSDLLSNNKVLLYEGASNGRLAVMPNTFNSIRYNLGNGSYNTGHGANTVDYNIWTLGSSTSTATPSGTRKSIARDGAYRGAGSDVSHFITGNGSNFLIGGGWDNGIGTSNNADIKLAELVVYTGIPTPMEQERIISYLALKYGIPKNSADNPSTPGQDERDYFASDGTTVVWDYSANAAYNNEIVAVGRDDQTEFLQKQATTSNDSLNLYIGSLASSNQTNGASVTNNNSYLVIGNNQGVARSTAAVSLEKPAGIFSRFEREWKITNTNFTNTFSIEIEWDSVGPFHIDSVRLLVDTDGDFSNAVVFDAGGGLTFTNGSIIISGISTAHIPINSTRFITVGSVDVIGGPLPIELLSFKATAINNTYVELAWQTASEINNDFFTIERSTDAQHWEQVAEVKGRGNSSTLAHYSTFDNKPYQGLSYYRLKQTDFDGGFSYSQIDQVTIDELGSSEVSIYPNPTKTHVTITGSESELNEISIFNSLGQDVSNLALVISKEPTAVKIDVSRLSAGVYYIKTSTSVSLLNKN